jgi:hypothetical protein
VDARRRQDERDGRDPDAAIDVKSTLMHDLAPELVTDAFSRGEPRRADTPFSEPWPLDGWPDSRRACARAGTTVVAYAEATDP